MNTVLYTVNVGHYDTVEPINVPDGWRALYFTDAPETLPEGWELARWHPEFDEPILASRPPKMMPWRYFDYDVCVYIDGRYSVVGDLNEFIQNRCDGWYCRAHYEQPGLYGEMDKTKAKLRPYVSESVLNWIDQQKRVYQSEGIPDALPAYPTNGAIVRVNNHHNRTIGELWWSEYYKWKTWNDQVDLWAVLWRNQWAVTVEPWRSWDQYFKLRRHNTWVYQ